MDDDTTQDTGGESTGSAPEGAAAGNTCKTCGKDSAGFKCDMCGTEAETHDTNHECGGDHCMPKCTTCNEAEAKCTCG